MIWLRVVQGPDVGHAVAVDRPVVVGRASGDLRLSDPQVSRRHVRAHPAPSGLAVEDLGSSAGTALDGHPAASGVVAPGGLVRLGDTVLRVLTLCRAVADDGDALEVVGDGPPRRLTAAGAPLAVGRRPDAQLTIDDATVSRDHARLWAEDGRWLVEDLGSTNGTRANGEPVYGRRRLSVGDEVRFGRSAVLVRVVGAAAEHPGDVALRVRAEGAGREWAVTVHASAGTTVAEVATALAGHVGLRAGPGAGVVAYRPDDGVVLPPAARWAATGMRDGDQLVVGAGSVPAGPDLPPLPARSPVVRTNQLPRAHHPPAEHVVRPPDRPDSTSLRGRGLLWQAIGGAGIMLSGGVLALVRPDYAIFGLLMVAVGVISLTASIMGEQSRRRFRQREWRSRLDALDRQLSQEVAEQQQRLRQVSPDDDELALLIRRHSNRLWERRASDDDALRLRVGTGDLAARVRIEEQRASFGPASGEEVAALAVRHRRLREVPVCTPGLDAPVVGLIGDPGRVTGLAARMLVEAAALHPPDQLRIWVLADSPGWGWTRWLPHVRSDGLRVSRDLDSAARLASELAELAPDGDRSPLARTRAPVLDLVVVTSGAARVPVIADALSRLAPGTGQVIALGERARDLPTGVAVVVEVDAGGSLTMSGAVPDAPLGEVRAAALEAPVAEELAAALAPLTLGAEAAASRSPQGVVELIAGCGVTTVDVPAVWEGRPFGPLQTPIGRSDDGGPLVLGFREDGPHGMVAGTTGAGKSELLQTLLAGLALVHPPEHLHLFLIDFKGGATFRTLDELPHVVGVVTDIESDGTLATRAFVALDAELERRKRLLDAARVPNIIEYQRLGAEAPEPLADLLVVIDEFALLVKNQPEVRERLDTVTAQGRSLGVHLLLATQTPSGVITTAIRANTNLWISLRVVSDAESSELIGRKDAARIPGDQPGRGFVRRGASDSVTGFRAARIARPLDHGGGVAVSVSPFLDDHPMPRSAPARRAPVGDRIITELEVLVGRIVDGARATGRARGRQLWSPPLPEVLPAAELDDVATEPDRLQVVVGLTDRPEHQRRDAAVVDLTAEGNALVVGILGAGKTTLLQRCALDLAERRSPAEVHLYGIDGGGGSLNPLAALPHAGAVIGVNDTERLQRLLSRLSRTVEERQRRMADSPAGPFPAWRQVQPTAPPWVVVLIDDFAALREAAEGIEAGQPLEQFGSLLRSGPPVGVHFVVAAAQATDLRVTQQNLIGYRLLLRPADSIDVQLLDLRLRPEQFAHWPPGRGVVRGGHLTQVAQPDLGRIERTTATWAGTPPAQLPRPVHRLPVEITRVALPRPTDGGLVLGVGGEEGDPVTIHPDTTGGVVAVMGRNRSGRSTALLSLLEASTQQRPEAAVVVLAPRPSPLRALADDSSVRVETTPDGITAALESLADQPRDGRPVVLVIDDAEALPSTMPDRLERIVRHAGEWGSTVLLAARTSDLQAIFGGWSKYVQSLRSGLALQPSQDEAYLLGVRLPSGAGAWPPGRGLWVEAGRTTAVQVALPEGAGAPSRSSAP